MELSQPDSHLNTWRRITAVLGWTRASYLFFSSFLLLVFLIAYIWWPLAEEYLALINWEGAWWQQLDWLLIGIFAIMSLLIMAQADFKTDVVILLIGLGGGFIIESWGTQTELWTYYTLERPPLWIIPAWPIASLAIDRLTRLLNRIACYVMRKSNHYVSRFILRPAQDRLFHVLYWLIFSSFYLLMLAFTRPALDKSWTLFALGFCALLILTPAEPQTAVLTFVAGAGLGYFLELWGTTRECWIYYTRQTPPLFAVLAHGMAAVAFWRVLLFWNKLTTQT